jgi:hypothetical protein
VVINLYVAPIYVQRVATAAKPQSEQQQDMIFVYVVNDKKERQANPREKETKMSPHPYKGKYIDFLI